MRKRILAAMLALTMALCLLPGAALAATEANVPYQEGSALKTCLSATLVESGTYAWSDAWSDGWYVVKGAVTISQRITVTDHVKLILADGAHLQATDGIKLEIGDSLTIYAQAGGTGQLTAEVRRRYACIGGEQRYYRNDTSFPDGNCGALTVYGGTITATAYNGTAIGGGNGESCKGADGGTVTVYGGSVFATSEYGTGIGGGNANSGGKGGDGGTLTVYGGSVTAKSTNRPGIGGGDGYGGVGGNGCAITVYGGTLTAESRYSSAIGGGKGGNGDPGFTGGNGGTLTVCGGTVSAASISDSGIGGGPGGSGMGGPNGSPGANAAVKVEPATGKKIAVLVDSDYAGSNQAEISGSSFSANTTVSSLTAGKKYVLFREASSPSVTTQPTGQSAREGQTATFSVAATGFPAPGYQWQVNKNDGSGWGNISGATGTSYTTGTIALSHNGYLYRCYIANSAGNVTSAQAALTVTTVPAVTIPVAVSPTATFPQGSAPELTVTVGTGLLDFNAAGNYDGVDPSSDLLPRLGTVGTPGPDGKVENGSIKLTLYQSYLNTLAPGTYRLRIKLKGGAGLPAYVEARVVVTAPGGSVPKTGDSALPELWIGLMLLAGAGLAASAALSFRKRRDS